MKFLTTLAILALLAAPALAADKKAPMDEPPKATGGFEGPVSGAQADTVEKAKKLAQDGRVVLTGNIASRVAGEKNEYIFKDATGEIPVLITPRQFKDNKVRPETKIQVVGKIDKSAPEAAPRVKASSIEVLK